MIDYSTVPMQGIGKIMKRSIFIFLQNYQFFTTTSATLAFLFATSALLLRPQPYPFLHFLSLFSLFFSQRRPLLKLLVIRNHPRNLHFLLFSQSTVPFFSLNFATHQSSSQHMQLVLLSYFSPSILLIMDLAFYLQDSFFSFQQQDQ